MEKINLNIKSGTPGFPAQSLAVELAKLRSRITAVKQAREVIPQLMQIKRDLSESLKEYAVLRTDLTTYFENRKLRIDAGIADTSKMISMIELCIAEIGGILAQEFIEKNEGGVGRVKAGPEGVARIWPG